MKANGAKRPGLVRMVCPYPLLAAGLTSALEEVGVRHGAELPAGGGLRYVVLWADEEEGLPEAVRRAREDSPGALVLVLGLKNDPLLARAALMAGARGYLHAGMTPEQVARALEVASEGELVAPRRLLEFLLEDGDASADLDALSVRQREILDLVVEGLSNAQIARHVFLSESTVKQHLRAAYKRLGVKNRTEAAKLMRRANR